MTDFFQQVWDLVCRIPSGRVAMYGQIAEILGSPQAAKTVGWALHTLPEGSGGPLASANQSTRPEQHLQASSEPW